MTIQDAKFAHIWKYICKNVLVNFIHQNTSRYSYIYRRLSARIGTDSMRSRVRYAITSKIEESEK